MTLNGQVRVLTPDSWQHTHTCYTCQDDFHCEWLYCKDQINRTCVSCIRAMQPAREDTR